MSTKGSNKYAAFFELFHQAQKAGMEETDHHHVVKDFTNDRTSSLRDLSHVEYLELCGRLRALCADDNAAASDRMRKKLIGILKGCGYIQHNGHADMPRIYEWVRRSGYLGKPLMHYTYAELPRLVFQAEQVQKSTVKHFSRHA